MQRTLRDLASHGNSALYPNIQINDDTLGTSYTTFPIYLKSQFVNMEEAVNFISASKLERLFVTNFSLALLHKHKILKT